MESMWWRFMAGVSVIAVSALFGLLMAFPIMWCWNYAVVHIWGLPTLTWGMAWCLNFLAGVLVKSALIDMKK